MGERSRGKLRKVMSLQKLYVCIGLERRVAAKFSVTANTTETINGTPAIILGKAFAQIKVDVQRVLDAMKIMVIWNTIK